MTKLHKIGIIGCSEGNGHPYSWSAIINGYDKFEIQKCGYPVIPKYLNEKKFPEDFLTHIARVDGIWSQDHALSEHIAKSTFIGNVYSSVSDLVENVDAVLLARDDSENHLQFLSEIRKYNKPVYIDKPIATNTNSLNSICDLLSGNTNFFSCSAFRFHPDLKTVARSLDNNVNNIEITGVIPKSWEKYSIHLIDPIITILPEELALVSYEKKRVGISGVNVKYNFEKNTKVSITTTGTSYGKIDLQIQNNGEIFEIDFNNTFNLFKSALSYFLENYIQNGAIIERNRYYRAVKLIECGLV